MAGQPISTRIATARRAGRLPAAFVVALGSAVAPGASAHVAASAADGLPPWSFEPWVLACLGLSIAGYAIGAWRLWRHAGVGRGVGGLQGVSFATGIALLVVALVSPLDALGGLLFSAHMIQHEILMVAAAPLLVIASPLALWAWALPFQWRRMVGRLFHRRGWRGPWRFLTGTAAAWVLHALALWLWHIPSWFDAALRSESLHTVQHLSFFLTALVYWWSVLGEGGRRRGGNALLSLFTTMVHTGVLGAILTLSRTAWYTAYATSPFAYGLTPLQDQQLGGVVMWVPAGFIYIVCGLVLATRAMGGVGVGVRRGAGRIAPS